MPWSASKSSHPLPGVPDTTKRRLPFCMEYIPPISEKLVLIDPLATIISHTSGYVRIDWQVVPMESEKVRSLFQRLLPLLQDTRHTKLLTDHSTMPPFWPADCAWLNQYWAPLAATQAGCTHIAVVESTETLRQVMAQASASWLQDLPVVVRYFDAFADAERWLGCF
jgi:hypothetical protein